jgi:hypothetical protein
MVPQHAVDCKQDKVPGMQPVDNHAGLSSATHSNKAYFAAAKAGAAAGIFNMVFASNLWPYKASLAVKAALPTLPQCQCSGG